MKKQTNSTILTRLSWGAFFFVLLFLVIQGMPRALGQRETVSTSEPGMPPGLALVVQQTLARDGGIPHRTLSGPWTQEQKLIASDGAANDVFGISVALDGDTALVGAVLADVNGNNNQGAAYVYGRVGDDWVEQAKLTASDGAANDQFGFSVALDGDTAVVSAPLAGVDGNAGQGAAWVFTRSGGTWTEQAKLTASDGAAGDQFGISVTIADDTALVGAWFADVGANTNQGAAWVFTRNGETWTEQARLVAAEGLPNDRLGYSVALQGDTALVGAQHANVGGNANQGAAYVFTRTGTDWIEQTRIIASDGAPNDLFGISVTLSGDTAVIGAPSANVGGNAFRGAAYVFVGADSSWVEQAKLIAEDGVAFDQLGWSVELDGNTALVSAPGFNSLEGAAYIFTGAGADWIEEAKLVADDGEPFHEFGFNVALKGGTALVGADRALVDGNFDQGAVYVFVREIEISLTASGYRMHGVHTVDLSWSGATSANVDIYRDGVVRATVPNTGSFTDSIGVRGGNARYTYKVCEAATQNCSNEVTVRFGGPPL
jgi:hypothetical protein